MRVMVLGATGFIGPHLVARLLARGHEVVAVSRRGPVAADRGDPPAIAALAESGRIDAVVDLLAYTLAGTAPLLDALAGRVRRYVLASSGDVYGAYDALHRKEAFKSGAAGPLDEEAPLRNRLYPYRTDPPRRPDDPQAWMDDYDKIPIEAAARAQAALEAAIVRLPMVYGPGDKNRRFRWAIAPMRAGAQRIEIDDGWARWRTGYGYVEDVAEGLALAAIHPAAAGRTYNLAPVETPDHLGWAARISELAGWKGELRTVPRDHVPEPLRSVLSGLDLSRPFITDSGRIRRELGFREVADPDSALRRTMDDEAVREHV
jgi:nucleoside-diphosphate-sugar epimerase